MGAVKKVWFTSDHHFNHKNIIYYAARPFIDINEMNKMLVHQWNLVVDDDDLVIHLGDVGFGDLSILSKLKGSKALMLGNHDQRGKRRIAEHFDYVCKRKAMSFEELLGEFDMGSTFPFDIILSHYPDPELSSGREFVIHGHVHSGPICRSVPRVGGGDSVFLYNVGVDLHGFLPVLASRALRELHVYSQFPNLE